MTVAEIPGDECRHLLATHDLGRFAVIVGGYPEVLPVNYTVVRDHIVIRTDPGLKLAHAHFERVCFEVDELDPAARTGWSVLVRGIVHEVRDDDSQAEEIRAAADLLTPWAGGAKRYLLLITPVSVTGRRIAS